MKDTILPVRSAYFEALDGFLTLRGVNVPVFNDIPENEFYPYVILSTQDSTDTLFAKGCYNTEDFILLDVVTGFLSGGGGKDADLIADQILQIVPSIVLLDENLQIVRISKASDTTLSEASGSHKIYRRLIRFRQIIHQKI